MKLRNLALSSTLTVLGFMSITGRANADMLAVNKLVENTTAATSNQANMMPSQDIPFLKKAFVQPSSWYVGLSASTISTSNNQYMTTRVDYGKTSGNYGLHTNRYGIAMGYDWNINQYFTLGVETDISKGLRATTSTSIYPNVYQSMNFENKINYGISIMPTLALTDRGNLFARLGYRQGEIELQASQHQSAAIKKGSYPAIPTVTKTVSGFVYGLGYGLQVSNHYLVRAEYDMIKYKQEIQQRTGDIIKNNSFTHNQYTEHEIKFSIIYKFNSLIDNPNTLLKLNLIGPYAGLDFGADNTNTELLLESPKVVSISYNSSIGNSLLNTRLGYGLPIGQQYYIGGEVFYQRSKYNYLVTLPASRSINISSKAQYGMDLLPGIKVGENDLIFLHLGVAERKMNLAYNPNINLTKPPIISANKNRLGYRMGIGFETGINKHLSLRFDYVHTIYRKISVVNPFNNIMVTATPNSDAITVGINYRMIG